MDRHEAKCFPSLNFLSDTPPNLGQNADVCNDPVKRLSHVQQDAQFPLGTLSVFKKNSGLNAQNTCLNYKIVDVAVCTVAVFCQMTQVQMYLFLCFRQPFETATYLHHIFLFTKMTKQNGPAKLCQISVVILCINNTVCVD